MNDNTEIGENKYSLGQFSLIFTNYTEKIIYRLVDVKGEIVRDCDIIHEFSLVVDSGVK